MLLYYGDDKLIDIEMTILLSSKVTGSGSMRAQDRES